LTASRRASGAVPATPVPLPVIAAAMPATWVPWGLGVPALGADSQSPLPQPFALPAQPVKVAPPSIFDARSGWARSTPESTMAIVWPTPVEVPQASGVLICCWPHWRPKYWSFGVLCAAAVGASARVATTAASVIIALPQDLSRLH